MTTRAKRLEKYLSETLGWDTEGPATVRICESCYCTTYVPLHKFCGVCGFKLPKYKSNTPESVAELEAAIAYALGEKK
jgi:uncharacterized paraquat-inducible protein A